jgi:hypothetical protein
MFLRTGCEHGRDPDFLDVRHTVYLQWRLEVDRRVSGGQSTLVTGPFWSELPRCLTRNRPAARQGWKGESRPVVAGRERLLLSGLP